MIPSMESSLEPSRALKPAPVTSTNFTSPSKTWFRVPETAMDHIVGIGGFTPRTTITGPLIKDRLAFTQSLEYRFVRTPVESLPPLQRDTTLESSRFFQPI